MTWSIDVVIKNYRCFPDSEPARLSIRPGFTAFVGANNVGKSSLLRFFYEFRGLFSQLAQHGTPVMQHAWSGPQGFGELQDVGDQSEVFSDRNERDIEIELEIEPPAALVAELQQPGVHSVGVRVDRGNRAVFLMDRHGRIQPDAGFGGYQLDTVSVFGSVAVDLRALMWAGQTLRDAIYMGAFRNAVNAGGAKYYDLNIGQRFIQEWDRFKNGPTKHTREQAARLLDDIRRIFEFDDFDMTPSEDNSTLIVRLNGHSYRLEELGAGIAQFIIVLAYVAVVRPTFVLIDEPESNLHPSLQIDFLTTLAAYSRDGVLFATHNLGLARASAEQLYSVVRRHQGESQLREYEATTELPELVGELSFGGYQALGFDSILLVEGPTEVKAVQQFLRLYGKEHRVVMVPLSGKSLIHGSSEVELLELKRLSEHVSALIDSERDAEGSDLDPTRAAFVDLCGRVELPCHVLQRRALENYFTDAAVKSAKSEKYRALDHYEKLAECSPSWSKSDNWRIARAMNRPDLDNTDLGGFLADL